MHLLKAGILLTGIYVFAKLIVWSVKYMHAPKVAKRKTPPRIDLVTATPAHNEGETIRQTVVSLIKAGMPRDRIFILPNGCRPDDTTAEIAMSYGVQVPTMTARGKEETLNEAIHDQKLFAGRTHVCFFDADTVVAPDYFRVIRERIKADPTLDAICGRPKSLRYDLPPVDPNVPRKRFFRIRRMLDLLIGRMLTSHRAVQYWHFHVVHKAAQGEIGSILVIPGCAGTYSMETLLEQRWSGDTRIGDMDMTIACAKLGKRIVFEDKAIVYTQDPANFHDYVFQLYKRWYRGLWMNMGKHRTLWTGWLSILNWDARLMFLDQFNIVIGPLVIWLLAHHFHWEYPLRDAVIFFGGMVALETIGCAAMEKRWDILPFAPTFPFLRLLDSVLFLASMPSIRVKREKSGEWNSPKRY